MVQELHFKKWLEDIGVMPGNQYSNAEDPGFAAKIRSNRSARGDKTAKEPGWEGDDPDVLFGKITDFSQPPPGSVPKNIGTNMSKMKKGMKKMTK